MVKETTLIALIVGIVAITALATNLMAEKNMGGKATLIPTNLNPTPTPEQLSPTPSDITGTGCSATHNECADNPSDDCDVRNKDFIFTQDYTFPNGINICADNRVVDCQDHTLIGTDLSNSQGIRNDAYNDVTIRNCNIRNYQHGIELGTLDGDIYRNTISQNMISYASYEIRAKRTHDSSIINNQFLGPDFNDPDYGGHVQFEYSLNNLFSGNTFKDMYFGGLVLQDTGSNQVTENTFDHNGGYGIGIVTYPPNPNIPSTITNAIGNNVVQANMIINNGAHQVPTGGPGGILMGGYDTPIYLAKQNKIIGNSIKNNVNGITLYRYAQDNTISGNEITDNTDNGIWIWGASDNNQIQNNIVRNNQQYGILLSANGEAVDSNRVCFNTLSDFQLQGSSGNTGDLNTCDNPDGWNDQGKTGCTTPCQLGCGGNTCAPCPSGLFCQGGTELCGGTCILDPNGCGFSAGCIPCPPGRHCQGSTPNHCGGTCVPN